MCDVIPYFHRAIIWDVRPLRIFSSYVSIKQNKIVFGTLVRISSLTNLALASWDFSCLLSPGLDGIYFLVRSTTNIQQKPNKYTKTYRGIQSQTNPIPSLHQHPPPTLKRKQPQLSITPFLITKYHQINYPLSIVSIPSITTPPVATQTQKHQNFTVLTSTPDTERIQLNLISYKLSTPQKNHTQITTSANFQIYQTFQ